MSYHVQQIKQNFGQSSKSNSNNRNEQNKCKCEQVPILKNLNDYEEVKNFLETMDKLTNKKREGCFGGLSYTKIRKYYDKILKLVKQFSNENLKAKLELEVGILIEYDIGRAKGNEKQSLLCLREFFKKTLELLDKENGKELFEKNWEVLVAYARKNLKD